ncbi:acyl-CoA dehydrogenase/oxidase [Polychytrium aggregatum]|uniref:acyl-CoA dehydrogenase/oxidase n=1 Tax=Polychytrium aggregatum TaxID=110093 RepID=UPI0022FF25D9|nr:acyl-CoA dehydrogenase/oxidase [Polychytrium aggregatum]KAI9206338.1 acyl-CoA dehydrogenase/oxidase [Polychytrium aggregatum]
MSAQSVFTRQDVAAHNSASSAWIVIDSLVYDITKFAAIHPGGEGILLALAGKDVTDDFFALHKVSVLQKYGPKLIVGKIADSEYSAILEMAKPGTISKVPYSEPSYLQGLKTPYYKPTHEAFRAAVRKFVEEELIPDAQTLDEQGKYPSIETFRKMGQFGLLAARMGPGPHLQLVSLPSGVRAEEFDYFHEMIAHEEIARLGFPGYLDGLATGMVIGLPPVLIFGAKKHPQVIRDVLSGNKRICLAITEPTAGSDVAQISTTAVKSPCGKYYIVNGVKKWITNGGFSDYFTTAVRTGGPGMSGISVLLIPRTEGVETKAIKTSYSPSAGTAYVVFENVKVPVENLLGKENQGFQVIMHNFNHERWFIICGLVRSARMCIEESFKWAHQRNVFGKKLIEQPVIRQKFAGMFAQVEGLQNWLENITFQMNQMSYKEQSVKLAGPIALLKFQTTRVSTHISDECCQIFGGRAITKTGMGSKVESFQRTFKFGSILGGSEEIMADLGIRQAIREMPAYAKL